MVSDNRWASRQTSWASGRLDRNPDCPGTYPDSSGTSENGPKRSWKYSRRFRNVLKPSRKVPEWPRMVPTGPERSWKVLEAFGRFHKFSDSTICATPPLDLGGKAPHRGWPKFGPSPIRTRLSKVGRTPHKEGVLGESFPTKGGVLEGLHPPDFGQGASWPPI